MKKFTSVIISVIMVATMLSGCGGKKEETKEEASAVPSKVEEIKAAGKLVLYTNAEFPPYEYLEGDEIVGVDMEIGEKIAKELGVKLEIVNADFDGLTASIASGKGDIVIAGMTITDEKKEMVDFSDPYVDSVQYIIVPNDSEIKVMEDLENKSIGGQEGTTGINLVADEIDAGVLAGKNTVLKNYKSAPIAMQDLINKRIDAVVIDEHVALSIAAQNDGYVAIPFIYAEGSPVTEQFGAVLTKGNDDLLKIVNKVIGEMLESGEIADSIEKHTEATS